MKMEYPVENWISIENRKHESAKVLKKHKTVSFTHQVKKNTEKTKSKEIS